MTEYELADIIASRMSNFLTALTVFFSIVTAYIVAAFMTGSRLTPIQYWIVNGCFLIAAGIVGFLVSAIFRQFYVLAFSSYGEGRGLEGAPPVVDFTWPLAVLMTIMVVGSLIFMHTTRKKGRNDVGSSISEEE